MTGTDDLFDEFDFPLEQAAALGHTGPLPQRERLSLSLDDGRTLSAIRWGDAPPVATFLHGAGLNAHTWDATILAFGAPALAIDLAGHGDSSWRDDAAYLPRTLALDVIPALGRWTGSAQVLVGQSLGGLTAAAVAAARFDLVRSLALVDITPGVDPAAGPAELRAFFAGPTDWADREELVQRALAFGLGGDDDAVRRGVYLNTRVRTDGRVEWKHHFARLAATPVDEATSDAVAAALGEAGWDDLAEVKAPTLLVRGDRGYVTDADLAEFHHRVPRATVETLPSGHNVQEQQPLLLGRRLRALAD